MIEFSIIVPTKNRYKYLYSIIKMFADYFSHSGKVELVIQDNSDDNQEILEFLKVNTIENLIYSYCSDPLAVTENFDKGILSSHGKYVTMLGDDDILSSRIIDVINFMNKHDVECIIFNKGIYKWPDALKSVNQNTIDVYLPSLRIRNCTGNVQKLDAYSELLMSIKTGAIGVGRMPEVYHGIVSRNALNSIYERAGTFFPGPSPDMAIACALALSINNFYYVDAPFTCSGQSINSAGGKGLMKKHFGRLEDFPHLPKYTIPTWEKTLPCIWTPQTIYADSMFYSLKSFDRQDLLEDFNYTANFTSLISQYPMFKDEVLKAANDIGLSITDLNKRIIFNRIKKIARIPKHHLESLLNVKNELKYVGIDDSYDVVRYLDNYIGSLNVNLD